MKIPRIHFVREEIKYEEENLVPTKYSKFIADMNFVCSVVKNDIFLERDKEIEEIFNCLQKSSNPNVMLVGPNGSGKSAIVQAIVYRTLNGKCPESLKNHHYIIWNIEQTLASLVGGMRNKIIDGVFEYITSFNNLVIVIDQIHLMEASTILSYYLSMILKMSNVKLIGITTPQYANEFFEYDNKVLSSVDIIEIKEPKDKKLFPMISKFVANLEKFHDLKIPEKIIKHVISLSSATYSEAVNPGKTLNFIEKSMIVAKEKGHTEVTKEDVNVSFGFDFERFNEMSFEDKKTTAYHEAGHYLVSKFSTHATNYKTKAISIVPSDYYLGVTLLETEEEKHASYNLDYYIDCIAIDLGGRIAELIMHNNDEIANYSSGAFSDLKNATTIARQIITEFGMIESSQNMTFFCNYDWSDLSLLSEERKKEIDIQTQKLINIAFERGKKILTNKIDLLHKVANELLEKQILDAEDLADLSSEE